jgi:hypothetical protein
VRQGARWTAAYHLQLRVAAVARPIRGSVGALGVLAAEPSWWWSPRRRLPGGASSRYRAVGCRGRGRPCPQASYGVGRRCPACGVHPSAFGVQDSAVQPSAVRSPGVVVQRVRRSAVCCPPVRCPAVRTRPSPPTQAVALGTRSSWPGDRDTGTAGGPGGCRAVTARSTVAEAGTRATLPSRVGRWEVGGGPGPPGWVRAAAAALAR